MNFKTLCLFIVLFFVVSCLFAQVERQRSLNINPAFVAGIETGASLRVEYEDDNWGKLFLSSQAGLLLKDGDFMLADFGAGYGSCVWNNDQNSLFLNGQLSCMLLSVPIGLPQERIGPTVKLELEYRRNWKNFSFQLLPFYRQLFLLKNGFENKGFYVASSLGVRAGLIWQFHFNGKQK